MGVSYFCELMKGNRKIYWLKMDLYIHLMSSPYTKWNVNYPYAQISFLENRIFSKSTLSQIYNHNFWYLLLALLVFIKRAPFFIAIVLHSVDSCMHVKRKRWTYIFAVHFLDMLFISKRWLIKGKYAIRLLASINIIKVTSRALPLISLLMQISNNF